MAFCEGAIAADERGLGFAQFLVLVAHLLFRHLVESLLTRDDYMLLADYQAYIDCQERVSDAYRDRRAWTRMSILNSARVGRFSSDRSMREYCRDIWKVNPIVHEPRP